MTNLLDRYPLKAHEILHFPLMFPDSLKAYHAPRVPYAGLEALYDFAGECGIPKGTVRTTLSRMKRDGLITTTEESGVTRYRTAKLQLEAMTNFQKRKRYQAKGFVLAVYSFEREQEKERTKTRELLEYFAFARFAQNSWITVGIETGELEKSLAEAGLKDHVFLFTVDKIDRETMTRLAACWKIPERAAFLSEFLALLRDHLASPLDDRDAFNRIGVAWLVFVIRVHGTEPPLPRELFPKEYAYDEIVRLLRKTSLAFGSRMYRHWKKEN
mgnify:CR=1 FL=1